MKILGIPSLSEAWFAKRREGITATDVPKILGVSPFGTAFDVWCEKTGKGIETVPEGPQLEWGRRTEEMHRTWVSEQERVVISASPGLVEDAELSWLLATPDGLLVKQSADGERVTATEVRSPHAAVFSKFGASFPTDAEWSGCWEAKAPGPWTKKKWLEGEGPLYAQVQVQAQLRVCGLGEGILSQLSWPGVEAVRLDRDERFIENMMCALVDFWENNVRKDIPPAVGSRDIDAIKRLHPTAAGVKALTDGLALTAGSIAQLDEELAGLNRAAAVLETERDAHRATIMLEMGDAQYATIGDYTFKRTIVKRAAQPETTYQTFRRVKEIR